MQGETKLYGQNYEYDHLGIILLVLNNFKYKIINFETIIFLYSLLGNAMKMVFVPQFRWKSEQKL